MRITRNYSVERKGEGMDKAVLAVMLQEDKNEAQSILGMAAARLEKGDPKGGNSLKERIQKSDGRLRVFEMQYNPSSLKLHTEMGRIQYENQHVPGQPEPNQQYANAQEMSLSFELSVDGEKTGETINALMAMLSSERNRQVLFAWGSIAFPGEVTQMSPSYTMFSRDGLPIRGQVSMSVRCDSTMKGQQQYWERAFEKL